MGRPRKDSRSVKRQRSVFLSDEEYVRLKDMAATWGITVSQMVSELINQAWESNAYLNGYDRLSADERHQLSEQRMRTMERTRRRAIGFEGSYYDRMNGLDRGLTNVMIIAAPENIGSSGLGSGAASGAGGGAGGQQGRREFPGIFCSSLGNVWVVPYGMLDRLTSVELMGWPCYASVLDYFAGSPIPKSHLGEFIDTNKSHVLSSYAEKAVLKRLYELYGRMRMPELPQSPLMRRQQLHEKRQRLIDRLMSIAARRAPSRESAFDAAAAAAAASAVSGSSLVPGTSLGPGTSGTGLPYSTETLTFLMSTMSDEELSSMELNSDDWLYELFTSLETFTGSRGSPVSWRWLREAQQAATFHDPKPEGADTDYDYDDLSAAGSGAGTGYADGSGYGPGHGGASGSADDSSDGDNHSPWVSRLDGDMSSLLRGSTMETAGSILAQELMQAAAGKDNTGPAGPAGHAGTRSTFQTHAHAQSTMADTPAAHSSAMPHGLANACSQDKAYAHSTMEQGADAGASAAGTAGAGPAGDDNSADQAGGKSAAGLRLRKGRQRSAEAEELERGAPARSFAVASPAVAELMRRQTGAAGGDDSAAQSPEASSSVQSQKSGASQTRKQSPSGHNMLAPDLFGHDH